VGDDMTQLGEPVAIGMVDTDDTKCPFDHDSPDPPKVDNDLIGIGSTLVRRMKSGKSTLLYKLYKPTNDFDSVLAPQSRPGHAFYNKAKVVKVPIKQISASSDQADTVIHLYPVTCAAHHCIPAQESLKRSKLLDFMIDKNNPDKLKDGKSTFEQKGIVWADVGYDVNGSENGVYLPGNYAVGGGRGGMKVWEGADDNEDDDEEDGSEEGENFDALTENPINDDAPASNLLTGELYDVSKNNRKWRYVIQAMMKTPGQFHDRHEDYSDFVLEVLNKIYDNYNLLHQRHIVELTCPECKKRAKKIEDFGIPTPFGLAKRLNGVSNVMRNHLNGSRWPPNVYTSKWVKEYLSHLPSQASKKRQAEQMNGNDD
jgi:hypothetical protein